jgi:hypothetical protein
MSMTVPLRTARVASLALVVLGLMVAPAGAHRAAFSDRNDTRGRLDIRQLTQGHAGPGAVVHRISMFERFSSELLRPDRGGLVIAFDTNGRVSEPERFLVVEHRRGELRAVLFSARTFRRVGRAGVSRPNARSIELTIPKRLLGSPAGYRWVAYTILGAAGGCRGFCVDFVPNSLLRRDPPRPGDMFLHDLTAPRISFPAPAALSTDASASLDLPLSFAVSDEGFAGLETWSLERRVAGGPWTATHTGTRPGTKQPTATLVEGEVNEFRVVAADRQGNTTTSAVREVLVPVDDADPTAVFGGTWGTVGGPEDFRGTLHTSTDPSATLTYAFDGTYVGLIAPSSSGVIGVAIDGQGEIPVDLSGFTGTRQLVFEQEALAPGPHTLTVTVQSGTAAIDAVAFE